MKNVQYRMMNGYTGIDIENFLFDIVGYEEFIKCKFDLSNAIYSRGFIDALQRNMKPQMDKILYSQDHTSDQEWHHIIIDGEMYYCYFIESEEEFEYTLNYNF